MNKIVKCVCWLGLSALWGACTNEDYKVYDTGQKDAVFFEYIDEKEEIVSSLDYAFNYDIADKHIVEIPVRLMGMPVDRDRVIRLAPVGDTDMKEGVHYTIESAVLPANEVRTIVKVALLRGNDPALLERSFKLTLELVENEDLRAVGSKDFTITYSDIRPELQPDWWESAYYMPMPDYSFETAQVFFQYFYELVPKANEDVFNEMINRYGDYFVRAEGFQGPFTMYDKFLIKYVILPMYEDHKDDPSFVWQYEPGL